MIGRSLLLLESDARVAIRLLVLYCNKTLELSDVIWVLNYWIIVIVCNFGTEMGIKRSCSFMWSDKLLVKYIILYSYFS